MDLAYFDFGIMWLSYLEVLFVVSTFFLVLFFPFMYNILGDIFQVKDVRLITDNKTRRSKGIAYVEFKDTESVPLAMGLTNQKLLGVPIIVQASQAEKNRLSMPTSIITKGTIIGPMRLYVGSLHFNITEDMLKGIFEPFGKV